MNLLKEFLKCFWNVQGGEEPICSARRHRSNTQTALNFRWVDKVTTWVIHRKIYRWRIGLKSGVGPSDKAQVLILRYVRCASGDMCKDQPAWYLQIATALPILLDLIHPFFLYFAVFFFRKSECTAVWWAIWKACRTTLISPSLIIIFLLDFSSTVELSTLEWGPHVNQIKSLTVVSVKEKFFQRVDLF